MIEFDNNIKQEEIQKQQELILKTTGSWRECMEFLYRYSTKTRYIQEERLLLNIKYPPYLDHQYQPVPFQVNINCSKPEIIHGQTPTASNYLNFEGKCVICFENVGSEKRKGLRAFQFECNGKQFFRHFTPYPYFNYHNVIVDTVHRPQIHSINTIKELLLMSEMMPGYKVASNSDKTGTGCTNLEHLHYQSGDYQFPVTFALPLRQFIDPSNQEQSIVVQLLNYPSCVLKVIGRTRESVEDVGFRVFNTWRTGSFRGIQKELQTNSLLATFNTDNSKYELYIFPRNGESPRFLTRESLHCIKKEFVGIFEFCGTAILPGRLAEQLDILSLILSDYHNNDSSSTLILPEPYLIFKDWLNDYYFEIQTFSRGTKTTKEMVRNIIDQAIQQTFVTILKDNSPIKLNCDMDILDSLIKQSGLVEKK
eukprot:gene2250-2773_t